MEENSTTTGQSLEERISELENNWKRALADYKNLEKRVSEEKEALRDFANLVLLSRLLPILDNLEMAQVHLNDEGLKYTIKEFKQVLEDEGLREIDPTNKEFDAATMEAVEMVDGEENKVIEPLRKGYLLRDKLIRPARVKVGKKKENGESQT
ncbi:MAG TPA: nucleotide exchange factor GrpE [Candidatus Saccharimonadales bacterium]|nr:nucleotide exchange factor GrpE [Candidatus Saccharimonadales bacterium]